MSNQPRGTALITGASSGIGASFARQLASQGYDLILVARRLDRLQTLADELKQRFSVCVEPLCADLSDPADMSRLESRIAEHDDLTLLVNNAGFGTVGSFVEVPIARHTEMIQVHVMATTRLCYAALPGFIQRGRGAIINVSSTAAFLPTHTTYSSTKSYLIFFSEALQRELEGTRIRVQALCPGLTHTEFHDRPEFKSPRSLIQSAPKFMWMSADDVVATSLRALHRGPVICIPGRMNQLLSAIARSALAPLLTGAMKERTANAGKPNATAQP